MINLSDYRNQIEELDRGQTMRVNHTDCPAGEDTRRRLYLTRPASSPEVVLAFCHNCQGHGVRNAGGYRDFYEKTMPVSVPVDGEWEMPPHLEMNPALWPTDASIWRMQKGLSHQDIVDLRIGYDPATSMVCLPMYRHVDWEGVPLDKDDCFGYQLRSVHGTGPKYLTALKDRALTPYTRFAPTSSDVCILVEDLASAHSVSKAGKGRWGVVCNYGIKIRPEILSENCDSENYLVWFDNDSDFVVDQAFKVARTWTLLHGNPTYVEFNLEDPKMIHDDKIRETINQWTK